jgi:hypothetical protein
VPFTLDVNHILISATINGAGPFNLILDTGMPYEGAILFESPKTAALHARNREAGRPAMANDVSIKIGTLELKKQTAMILPPSSFAMEGIIGFSLFSRFIVKIDNNRSIVTLSESIKLQDKSLGNKVPIILKDNFPYVQVNIELLNGKQIPVELIVDIGATHALSLTMESNPAIVPPEKVVPILVRLPGVGAEIDAKVGRIKSLTLGKYAMNDLVSTFLPKKLMPVDKDGNLGNGTFRKFNITFDYRQKCMYLEPSNHFVEPFEYNMTGLQIKIADNGFVVLRVNPNSPAEEAGLKAHDQIFEINGTAVSQLKENDLYLLFMKEGESINIKAKRGQSIITASFTMRRLI